MLHFVVLLTFLQKNFFFLMLPVWASQYAAMFVRSSPMKNRKGTARYVLIFLILLPHILACLWRHCGTKWQHRRSCFRNFQTSIFFTNRTRNRLKNNNFETKKCVSILYIYMYTYFVVVVPFHMTGPRILLCLCFPLKVHCESVAGVPCLPFYIFSWYRVRILLLLYM